MSKIIIVDDQPLMAAGTKLIIQQLIPECSIAIVENHEQGLLLSNKEDYNLFILNSDLSVRNDFKMIQTLRRNQPTIKILIHSDFDEQLYALPYLQAGADGFISKNERPEEFKEAVNTVTGGMKYVSSKMQEVLISQVSPVKQTSLLTPVELQVMQLLVEGKWTKEIAKDLQLAQNTISIYKRRLFNKFKVRDSMELCKKISKDNKN